MNKNHLLPSKHTDSVTLSDCIYNMVLPRTSMRNFLLQAKASLRTAISKGEKVTLVIGNESAGK
jgi:hypothetical protein